MRKSPFSTPGGSDGQRDFRRQGYNGTGYGQFQRGGADSGYNAYNNDCVGSGPIQASPQKTGDDFIPLGYSSPVNHHQQQQRNSGNWRGSGGRYGRRGTPGSGGYNSYRNNSYHNSSKSSFNDSNSSPNYFQKQNFFHRRPRQKDGHRQVDISSYVNVRSMLEDPWADLMRNFEHNNQSVADEHKNDLTNLGTSVDESNSEKNLVGDDVVIESENSNDLEVAKERSEEADIDTKTS